MDPNNTAWSNNKNRFGYNMLVKMGWNEDKGLGQKEDGIKSHIKVKIRKDNKGIGAERTVDGEKEWKKGTEGLNNVLARLSRSVTPPPSSKQLNFVAAKETSISGSLSDSEKDKVEKKRKHSEITEDKKEEGAEEPQVKKPRQVIINGGACRPGRMLNMKNVRAKTRELSKEDMACIFGDFLIKRDDKENEDKKKKEEKEEDKEKKEKEKKKKEEEDRESEKAMDESFKTTTSTVSSKDYFKEKMKQKKLNASK